MTKRKQSLDIHFSCAHFYHQTKWSSEQNEKTFGKCFSRTGGHGHDYRLRVTWPSEVLTENRAHLALAGLREVLDHKHLNHDFPEFQNQIPTSENLLLFCETFLRERWGPIEFRLELWESARVGAFKDSTRADR